MAYSNWSLLQQQLNREEQDPPKCVPVNSYSIFLGWSRRNTLVIVVLLIKTPEHKMWRTVRGNSNKWWSCQEAFDNLICSTSGYSTGNLIMDHLNKRLTYKKIYRRQVFLHWDAQPILDDINAFMAGIRTTMKHLDGQLGKQTREHNFYLFGSYFAFCM